MKGPGRWAYLIRSTRKREQTLLHRMLNVTIARTTDQHRALVSPFRWFADGSGLYLLRVRGLLPVGWVQHR